MDFGNAAQIFSALISLMALIIAIASSRSQKHNQAIGSLAEKQTALELKVQAISNHLEHLPDIATTHRLETTMARLEGELKVMAESLKPVARISERLQEFLLEQVSRK